MPSRFAVVALLGFCVILAFALSAITSRDPRRRRLILATVGCALAFELLPVPRTLYSAEIPAIYRTIARDPRPVRVLQLPFGIRDGLSSIGDFGAAAVLPDRTRQAAHRRIRLAISPQRAASRDAARSSMPWSRSARSASSARAAPSELGGGRTISSRNTASATSSWTPPGRHRSFATSP